MPESPTAALMPGPTNSASPGRRHYLALLAIVLFGAVLRFAMLDRPALWGDEAATWARTSGTFMGMLEGNRSDGFVPLHYEIYWALGKAWTLTPWRMRLVPAIAGTLMVPAMYFLARQLLQPRASLLVALMAATSAFMLNYSRDAKMYMHAWLFMTMHVACFLWWLRGGGGVAWWASLACGVAAVGMHASAWLVMPAEVVILATYGRPRIGRWAMFLIALAVMGAGPWYYYRYYNTWTEESGGIVPIRSASSGREGNWFQSGIQWIDYQTRDKTGPELVRDSATAYLFGYSRAEEEQRDGTIPIESFVLNLAWGTLTGIVLIGVVGLPRWPLRSASRCESRLWSPWQRMLWLGVWLTIPTYAFFYCRSVPEPTSPIDWLRGAVHYFSWQLAWMTSLCIGLILVSRRDAVRWSIAWILAGLLAACLVYSICKGGVTWYFVLIQLCYRPWLIGGLIAIGAAVSWVSCGDRFASRAMRVAAGVAVAVVILAACEASWRIWESLHRISASASRPVEWYSIWMPRYLAIVCPAVLLVLAILICRLPGRVLKVLAVAGIVAANLAQFAAHIKLDPEPRIDLMADDLVKADRDPAMLVYVTERTAMGAPGGGTIGDVTGRYYVALKLGQSFPLALCRHGPTDSMLHQLRRFTSARWVGSEIRRKPEIRTLVIWQRTSQRDPDDLLKQELGPDWRQVSQTTQVVRRHWNWQFMDELRRIEYRRDPYPTSPPSR